MRRRFYRFITRLENAGKHEQAQRCQSKFCQLIADEYKSDKVIAYWTKNPDKMAEVAAWLEKADYLVPKP
jgi:hypothetical protein